MIRWHDSLASTMDEAHRLAEAGAPHGTAVAARIQTAGRGRRGRTWEAPAGGLWMSVVCRPAAAGDMNSLSVRAGEALAATLMREVPGLRGLTVKPPNDLLVGGRKLAGLLCEARWEGPRPLWVVIGAGLNVSNPVPESLAGTAVSLAELGCRADAAGLAEPVREALARAGR